MTELLPSHAVRISFVNGPLMNLEMEDALCAFLLYLFFNGNDWNTVVFEAPLYEFAEQKVAGFMPHYMKRGIDSLIEGKYLLEINESSRGFKATEKLIAMCAQVQEAAAA